MTIFEILRVAKINNLDATIIIAHVLHKTRAYVLAHSDQKLNKKQVSEIKSLYKKRSQHWPLAYLIHKKEFFGRTFKVDRNVLIPRPETEQLICTALELGNIKTVLDVGTGSGCLAITLALENPSLELTAIDTSLKALEITRKNWQRLKSENTQNIVIFQSDLLKNIPKQQKFHLIIANLPYVDKTWRWNSPELKKEPRKALYAPEKGLKLIKKLIKQAPPHLVRHGYLLLECDTSQIAPLTKFASQNGFKTIKTTRFSLLLQKTTTATPKSPPPQPSKV